MTYNTDNVDRTTESKKLLARMKRQARKVEPPAFHSITSSAYLNSKGNIVWTAKIVGPLKKLLYVVTCNTQGLRYRTQVFNADTNAKDEELVNPGARRSIKKHCGYASAEEQKLIVAAIRRLNKSFIKELVTNPNKMEELKAARAAYLVNTFGEEEGPKIWELENEINNSKKEVK